jgi:hypothetical protein
MSRFNLSVMSLFDEIERFISLSAAEQDDILLEFHRFSGDS